MKAEMFNYKRWIFEVNPERLKSELETLLLKSEFKVLNHCEHFFEPYGYTCVWVLAESHLAIHTFPEADKTYVELSSCIEDKLIRFESLFEKIYTEAHYDLQ